MGFKGFIIIIAIGICFWGEIKAQDELYEINTIIIQGNKLTKEHIIQRELLFREGDKFPMPEINILLEKSRENLINTSLFNFVIFEKIFPPGEDKVIILIKVVERWYIWPIPIFEHAERNLPAWLKDPDFDQLNYGLQLNWNNFRGRRELLQFKARLGYKEQYMIEYTKPNLDKQQKHGINFRMNKARQHEVVIRSVDNEPEYLKDNERYLFENFSTAFSYIYRPRFYVKYKASLNYFDIRFRNEEFHNEYLGTDYGAPLQWLTLRVNTEFNYRDNYIYPLKGYYLNLFLAQRGLGIIDDFDQFNTIFAVIASSHQELAPRFHIENLMKARIMKSANESYIFREGFGFDTYVRGFEYYIIEGDSYFINVNNLKYTLLPMHTHTFKLIPWEQFNKIHYSIYSNLFFDMAYIQDRENPEYENGLQDQLLYSTGIGLDFVTYYDQVYRLEFTLNSLGEFGVFFHLETPFGRW